MSESKLNKIEETLAHQDQQIQDLSDVIIRQTQEIATLKKEMSKLQGKVEQMDDGAPNADQKPPHY